MTIVIFTFLMFFSLLEWIVIIDVILSWAPLLGIRWRPRFISSITEPLYAIVRQYIPTNLRGLDFTPVIVMILIEILSNIFITIDPGALAYMPR